MVASGSLERCLVDPPAFLVVEELDLAQESFGCVTTDSKYASGSCNYCKIDSASFHGFQIFPGGLAEAESLCGICRIIGQGYSSYRV